MSTDAINNPPDDYAENVGYAAEKLVSMAIAYPEGWKCNAPRWVRVSEIFKVGMTTATRICRNAGFDPFELKPRHPTTPPMSTESTSKKPSPLDRLAEAWRLKRGIRFTAEEVKSLMSDTAIHDAALCAHGEEESRP
jgi:hypothetical protein